MIAPTSDIVRPNPASTAVSIESRPIASSAGTARQRLAPRSISASP